MEARALLKCARDCADHGHLEAVQYPSYAQRGDDECMEAAEGEAIEPGGYRRRDCGFERESMRLRMFQSATRARGNRIA